MQNIKYQKGFMLSITCKKGDILQTLDTHSSLVSVYTFNLYIIARSRIDLKTDIHAVFVCISLLLNIQH